MKDTLNYICVTDYEKYRNDIFAFWEKINGDENKDFFDSFYRENPLGDPMLGLCYDGENLVGQENYIRQDIGSNGKIFRGAMGINTLVDPRYRLFRGIFGKLCTVTIDALRSRVDLIFAFANEESRKYYIKYFGWSAASKIRVYKKITSTSGFHLESALAFVRPGKKSEELAFESVDIFEQEVLEPLLRNHLGHAQENFFYKSTAFLNWKYLNNRRFKTQGFYITSRGDLCGYVVTYDEGFERKIVDMIIRSNNEDLFEKVIAFLTYKARNEGMRRLVIYATPGCWYESILRRHFFIERWSFDFIACSLGTELPEKNWVVQIGDFDIF